MRPISEVLRIITELVINHTSDKHPWFQRARLAPADSPERDYYVWSDTNQKYEGTRIIFSDTETSNWTWDPEAKSYYWHRFFSHQPDLNFDNPAVLREVIDVMYFWLDMGVDGLRLDAVPYLCEREGTNNENLPETHDILRKIRAALEQRYPDRMLLAEANQWPEDVLPYFGDGDECHMAFHFPLMPRIYMAVAQEDRHPVTDIMYQTPKIPENCQWAFFLRNHDELTLEMVTNRERDYLWNFYAADKQARINFGIRRRLAPLMENDRRKIELLNSLLLSMPGTPVLYYGDEIGMGDNIYLGGPKRSSDTHAMVSGSQWWGLVVQIQHRFTCLLLWIPFMDIKVSMSRHSVGVQYSLFNWMRKIIATIQTTQVFGRGSLRFLAPANRTILAYIREYEDKKILCVANMSRSPQAVELDLVEFHGHVPVEMLGQSRFPAIGELPYLLTLAPFGFYWFRLTERVEDKEVQQLFPEMLTLVLPKGWAHLFEDSTKKTLEQKLLPSFLMTRRWYKGKNVALPKVDIRQIHRIGTEFCFLVIDATPPGEETHCYTMVLGFEWDDAADDPFTRLQKDAISKVRTFNRVGILFEATQHEKFITQILTLLKHPAAGEDDASYLAFHEIAELPDIAALPIKPLGAEQTNSSALIGDDVIIKFIRQPLVGINPEEEVSRYLTETSPFKRTPKLLASLNAADLGQDKLTVALIHEAVRNQGDGWSVTLAYLARLIQDISIPGENLTAAPQEDNYYNQFAKQMGRRTGELHTALSKTSGNKDFDPEPLGSEDRSAWIKGAVGMMQQALHNLERALSRLHGPTKDLAHNLLAQQTHLTEELQKIIPSEIKTPKIRVHGDYHLGQVLVSDNDFYIIDYEGEPARGLAERRSKTSPFKDVAGMMRSFDYAAAAAWKEAAAHAQQNEEKTKGQLDIWVQKAKQAFLEGYSETAPLKDGANTQQALIRFFTLEKALYEIVYETQHRPDWLSIPLLGVLGLLNNKDKT